MNPKTLKEYLINQHTRRKGSSLLHINPEYILYKPFSWFENLYFFQYLGAKYYARLDSNYLEYERKFAGVMRTEELA